MRYFYDTEFIEDGATIDLISIAIVAEDGRELYLVNHEFEAGKASTWVAENVLKKLPPVDTEVWIRKLEVARQVHDFIREESRDDVELWADYGAYDHIALCQLYGTMMDLPPNIPMFTNDFQQAWRRAGRPELPADPENAHDALADARHLRDCYELVK